jgi:hypothetical protein
MIYAGQKERSYVLVRWHSICIREQAPLNHLPRERGLCAKSRVGVGCVRGKVGQLLCEMHHRQCISEVGRCRSCRLDKWESYKGGPACCVVGHR